MYVFTSLFSVLFICLIARSAARAIVGNPLAHAFPCEGNDNITMQYETGLPPEEENKYSLYIRESLSVHSRVRIKFDHGATVQLVKYNKNDTSYARIYPEDNGEFTIRFYRDKKNGFSMVVQSTTQGVLAYPISIDIDTEENCKKPNPGILDNAISGEKDTAESEIKPPPGPECGRRQVSHTELITNSVPTKPGVWPWHTALYIFEKQSLQYKCGGTLISKNAVLTAAHCTTIRGLPISTDIIFVVLGKYNLVGGDTGRQEKEVIRIIVHERYNASNLDNDISILKLKSEAEYSDYVQTACLWHPSVVEKITFSGLFGTVVGWGFDQNDQLSSELRQAVMPIVSQSTCIKSNPVFFGKMLNSNKFCAGFRNGTSACNGDSGGGFTIFVPDVGGSKPSKEGSWYIRGIVSVGISRANVALCDPHEYVLFTDAAKYRKWIEKNMK